MGTTYSKCWGFRPRRNEERGNYLDKISSSEIILGETTDHQRGSEHRGKHGSYQNKTMLLYNSRGHSPILVNVLQDSKLARNNSKIRDVSKSSGILKNPVPKNTRSSYKTPDASSRSSSSRFPKSHIHYKTQRTLRTESCLPIFPYSYGIRTAKEILNKAVENNKSETITEREIPPMKTNDTNYKGDEENNNEIQQIQASAGTTNVSKNMLERSIRKRKVQTPLRTRPHSALIKRQASAPKIQEDAKALLENQANSNTVKAKALSADIQGKYVKRPLRRRPASRTQLRSESIRRQKSATKRCQAGTVSISPKRVGSTYTKRQLENVKINSIDTPSSTTIMTSKCIVKIPRHMAHAPHKVRLFLKEHEKIESVVTDPDDQRIDIICDRHMCKLDIYAKREIAGNSIYIMDIECEVIARLKECIHDLDAVFGLDIYWQLDAALKREYRA